VVAEAVVLAEQPVPPTGPGLTGFVAHLLWQVYRYFPSPGGADWVLLFVLIAVASHLVFLPYLWRCVKRDMVAFKEGTRANRNDFWELASGFWGAGWMLLWVWFFSGTAGQSFLAGRRLAGIPAGESHAGFFWASLVIVGVLTVTGSVLVAVAPRPWARGSYAYQTRCFRALYAGGGVIVDETGIAPGARVPPGALVFLAAPALLLYPWSWNRPVAVLVLVQCFVGAAVLMDGARVAFVYLQHRRVFGRG
jgi:hypothetical protein